MQLRCLSAVMSPLTLAAVAHEDGSPSGRAEGPPGGSGDNHNTNGNTGKSRKKSDSDNINNFKSR